MLYQQVVAYPVGRKQLVGMVPVSECGLWKGGNINNHAQAPGRPF